MDIEDQEIIINHLILVKLLLHRNKLLLLKRRNQNKRRWWVKPHNTQISRYSFGTHHKIFKYFKINDHEEFYQFTRMSVPQFDILHNLIEPKIRQRSNREPLSAEIRLVITLRWDELRFIINKCIVNYIIFYIYCYSQLYIIYNT